MCCFCSRYHYNSGVYPSTKGNNFYIEVQEDYRCYKISYKLNSVLAARDLHRTTVEFCTFFTHETVSDWVRDSKSHTNSLKTFTSLLKHRLVDSERKRPKVYKFDVSKTAREVFEHAWKCVADEKARAIQLISASQTPETDGRIFKFGPDTPRTPGQDKLAFTYEQDEPRTPAGFKKAIKCGQGTPRTPKLDRKIFQFVSLTPRPDKQVFKFECGTPRTPKLDKPVFQFSSAPPRLEKQVFSLESGTPRTPRINQHIFQFGPSTKQVLGQDHSSQRPSIPVIKISHFSDADKPNPASDSQLETVTQKHCSQDQIPDKQVFNFRPSLTSTIISDEGNSLWPKNCPSSFLQVPSFYLPQKDSLAQSPVDTDNVSEIASNLKLSPLAMKQKHIFKERFLCKVCKREYKTCAFVPCGHVVTCWGCALACRTCTDCNANVESVKPVKYL